MRVLSHFYSYDLCALILSTQICYCDYFLYTWLQARISQTTVTAFLK